MEIERMNKRRRVVGSGLAAVLVAIIAAGPSPARADVKLPSIFGSHMVLQRDQKDKVWGWAEPGEEVTVAIAGQTKTAKAGADGAWHVMLDPMPTGGPHTMTVKGKNTVTFEDVLVGRGLDLLGPVEHAIRRRRAPTTPTWRSGPPSSRTSG